MSEQYPPQPGQPPYGQPPYGQQPPYGYGPPPGYGPPVAPPGYYASFGQRAIATLWDLLYMLPAVLLYLVGFFMFFFGVVQGDEGSSEVAAPFAIAGGLLMVCGGLLGIGLTIRNLILRQGRTGYTWGKAKVGIRCIREIDGQASGVGNAVARYFLHSIINQACYLDYLWAAWDPKTQTLTDKLLKTVVINQPEGASAR